jgi:hypothetical protein
MKFLTGEQLLFCIRHGLSIKKEDYTEQELIVITLKAIQERIKRKQENRNKLINILEKGKTIWHWIFGIPFMAVKEKVKAVNIVMQKR